MEEDLVVIPKGGNYCLGVLGAGAEAESDTVGAMSRSKVLTARDMGNQAALLVSC